MTQAQLRLSLFIVFVAIDAQVMAQTFADPTRLPVANRQTPQWDTYISLGILNAPWNTGYNDPVTSIPVRKITDGAMSNTAVGTNTFMYNDYTEGGPYISREWANGWHTLLIRRVISGSGVTPFLVDYQRGGGASNFRAFTTTPKPRQETSLAFASSSSTDAHVMYFVDNVNGNQGPKLYRMNTATGALEGEAHIPSGGSHSVASRATRFPYGFRHPRMTSG